MRTTIGVAALLGLLAAVGSLSMAAAQSAAAVPAVSVGAPSAEASFAPGPGAGPVAMVELVLRDNTRVTGRLVSEDDQRVQVTSLSGSTIGYSKDVVRSIRSYTLPASAFAEQSGDVHAGQLWKSADGPGAYAKAREQYHQALLLATTAQERDRIQGKVAALENERDALQAEALRKAALQKAADEAEIVRLQKQLTQQQISAMHTLGPRLQQIDLGMRQTSQALATLHNISSSNALAVNDLARQLAGLQVDLTNLQNSVVYVPYPVRVDPKRPRGDGPNGDGGRDRDKDRDRDRDRDQDAVGGQ